MVGKKNLTQLVIVAILIVVSLAMYSGLGEDQGYFGGSDDAGEQP